MTISNSLTIKQVAKNDKQYSFDCIGSIDAHADQPLEILRKLPSKIKVILDFNKVERVNSMGLSLLLRIFEDWEKNNIEIEIHNLNRMVSMLFKITGLGRFIQSGESTAVTSERKLIEPKASTQNLSQANTQTENLLNGKLNFVASLQSGQQLSGWYLFNTYLQRKMQRAIHFEQYQDLQQEAFHLFFAKPFDACSLMLQKDFIPIVRPVCEADEVVILCRADDNRTLQDFMENQPTVVTADQGSFVYLLGRFLCDESGIDSSSFSYQFVGNEIKSLQMLIRKKAELAFILKKTYQGLSSYSRNNVRLLDESTTDFAFHQFCVAPNLKDQEEMVSDILLAMEKDKKGKQILEDIQFNGWIKPEEAEIKMLQMVFDRYAN